MAPDQSDEDSMRARPLLNLNSNVPFLSFRLRLREVCESARGHESDRGAPRDPNYASEWELRILIIYFRPLRNGLFSVEE